MEIKQKVIASGNEAIQTKKSKTILEVRPLLHCPEIDPYDKISLDQIT